MTTEILLPPRPDSLLQSMRDIGYSVETAVADLIDNSISAGASNIRIFWEPNVPCIAIVDDGRGMSEGELIEAMRHGSSGLKEQRRADDLGRFGLGLKTASLSQCRRLTVVSSQGGVRYAVEWDLDLVESKAEWALLILNNDISSLPCIEYLKDDGTIVIWRDLDRLFEGEKGKIREDVVSEKFSDLRRHLSLVFHRFLSGKIAHRKKISIFINEHVVEAFDPFCSTHPATQKLPEETLKLDGRRIRIQPYILPHHSKLSKKEYDYYQDRGDLSEQGLYVYRAGRLMVWGKWLGLIPKGGASKLARIQIDFPNSLDKHWSIDIKKSDAKLPRRVRDRLRQLIDRICAGSRKVIEGKVKKPLFSNNPVPVWNRYADRDRIRYCVNREHPLVLHLRDNIEEEFLAGLDVFLESVESSLPIGRIDSDCLTDSMKMDQISANGRANEETLIQKLYDIKKILSEGQGMSREEFREIIGSLGQYTNHMDIVDRWIKQEWS